MKTKLFIFLVLLVGMGIFATTTFVHAQATTGGCSGGTCSYVPLEPLPGVNSSGLNFADYVSGMFRLLITLGALFAVLMLVIAGIGYMIADSGVKIGQAKERAKAALYGLLLLTACWLILYTVNPNLLRFDLFTKTLDTTAKKSTSPGAQTGGSSAGGASTPTKITIDYGGLGSSLTVAGGSSPENLQTIRGYFEKCTALGGTLDDGVSNGDSTTFTCK